MKLTAEQVLERRAKAAELRAAGASLKDIAAVLGCGVNSVTRILNVADDPRTPHPKSDTEPPRLSWRPVGVSQTGVVC